MLSPVRGEPKTGHAGRTLWFVASARTHERTSCTRPPAIVGIWRAGWIRGEGRGAAITEVALSV